MRSMVIFCFYLSSVFGQKDANFVTGRSTIVHLFEWKWNDIAAECENFLQQKGYGGVQISPPNEYLIVADPFRPWWERYQPVSYTINSRSGNENAFLDMTTRCNAVGVRIYVDIVINHMAGTSGTGTANNNADYEGENYPGVPYGNSDFHEMCEVNNTDPETVRNCGAADLNQSLPYVRGKIIDYMNHLISLGVAGFRIDSAKYIWPLDLGVIYFNLKPLNTSHNFPEGARAFIFQEVEDYGEEAVSKNEYTDCGAICEFEYGLQLSFAFQGDRFLLSNLSAWGAGFGSLVDGNDSVAFIDNHNTQRTGDIHTLTYKNSKPYKMATAFMQAHPYGTTRIMSSYAFDTVDQSPPQDDNGNLISPSINEDGSCGNGYICEHRWRQIYNMVGFRNAVKGTEVENWWDEGYQQIAFSRGNKGFIVFALYEDLSQRLNTGLPPGTYCDVISGNLENGSCTGTSVTVDDAGYSDIILGAHGEDGVLAIHVEAKLETTLL